MDDNELRVSLERVRAMCAPDQQTWDLSPKDVAALCRLLAAVEPTDDGEPVTVEWLKSVGFVEGEGHMVAVSPARRDGDGLIVRRLSSGEWNAEDGFVAILLPDQTTRGDVRRLLKALGVTTD